MNKTPSWFARPVLSWYYFVVLLTAITGAYMVDGVLFCIILIIETVALFLASMEASKRERFEKKALISCTVQTLVDIQNEILQRNRYKMRFDAQMLENGDMKVTLEKKC